MSPSKAGKTGVILLNMGGPSHLEAIEGYLRRIFMDPMLIQLPAGFLYRRLLARFVASRRAARVSARYQLIGGGSPLPAHTQVLASALEQKVGIPVRIAMRYSEPGAREAVCELKAEGVTRGIAVPLYPQYSHSTTGSSLADLEAAAAGELDLVAVDRHFEHPGFVGALASGVARALEASTCSGETFVLFTAHSIPLKYTAQGDPYISEVRSTVDAVVEALGLTQSWSLAFQSAPGVGKWHGPRVEDVLPELLDRGVKGLVVCPVTFVSENLETLYDLDIVLSQKSRELGFESFVRVEAPGATPAYVEVLCQIVREKME